MHSCDAWHFIPIWSIKDRLNIQAVLQEMMPEGECLKHTHTKCLQKVFIPLDLFHILLCCSLNSKWIKTNALNTSPIYTHYPKGKHVWHCFANLLKIKHRNIQFTYSMYSHPFAMTLQIERRCIQFPFIILEMALQLDWSPHVANSIVWTWFRKNLNCLYEVPQLIVHVRAETIPRSPRNCP